MAPGSIQYSSSMLFGEIDPLPSPRSFPPRLLSPVMASSLTGWRFRTCTSLAYSLDSDPTKEWLMTSNWASARFTLDPGVWAIRIKAAEVRRRGFANRSLSMAGYHNSLFAPDQYHTGRRRPTIEGSSCCYRDIYTIHTTRIICIYELPFLYFQVIYSR